jgi:hypothetical protein
MLRPHVPATVLPCDNCLKMPVSETRHPKRRRRDPRGIVAFLIALPALLLAQWILDVAGWFNLNLSHLSPFRWLNRLPELSPPLRFPPFAQVGFAALACALIAFFVWFRRGPQTEILRGPMAGGPAGQPPKAHGSLAWGTTVLLVAAALFSVAMVVRGGLTGVAPPLAIWALGPVCLAALAHLADRREGGTSAHRSVARNLAYFGGIVAMLAAAAFLLRGRPLPSAACTALAIALFFPVFRGGWAAWDEGQRVERLMLPVIAVGAFLLCSYGLDSWAWGLEGDDSSFFDFAARLARGGAPRLLGAGAFGYHPALSSAPAALSMLVFGRDAFAWRLSNPLLLAASIPLFHYCFRSFLRVEGALIADTLLASAHYFQTFFKIGYNSSTALASLGLSLACLTWALRSRRHLAFAATGVALGFGFFAFGVAWLFPLWLSVWLLVYVFPATRRNASAWLLAFAATLVTALPILLNAEIWHNYLRHSPLWTAGPAMRPAWATLVRDCAYGFTLFATNGNQSHGIVTAHTDPITGAGIVLGIAALLAGWTDRSRARRAWLGLAGVATVTIAAFQRYGFPPNTRMFLLVPFYAFVAAVGFVSLAHRFFPSESKKHKALRNAALVVLVIGSASLNTAIALVVSPRHSVRGTANYLALYVQRSVGPPPATLLVAVPHDDPDVEDFLETEELGSTRLRALGSSTPLQWRLLRYFRDAPAICLIPRNADDAASVRALAAGAWPGSHELAVGDYTGSPSIFAVINPGALPGLRSVPGYWHEQVTRNRPPPLTPKGEDVDLGWFEVVSSFQQYRNLRVDRSVDGRPLSVGGRIFAAGLGTHANSRIQLHLENGYHRFVGRCGVDDEVGKRGSVVFRIIHRGRILFASRLVRGGSLAVPFDVDVTGFQNLTLLVGDADGSNSDDHADWLELRLLP